MTFFYVKWIAFALNEELSFFFAKTNTYKNLQICGLSHIPKVNISYEAAGSEA